MVNKFAQDKPWTRRNLNQAQINGCVSYKCKHCAFKIGSRKKIRLHIKLFHGITESLSDEYEATE